jgi:YHS domain-containing protein
MKNLSLILSLLLSGMLIVSCNNISKENKPTEPISKVKVDTAKFTSAMVDNKRDPSCGMPVAAGIEDTVHYKNKVLGFCSKECKDEFLKDPKKNITAADLKK